MARNRAQERLRELERIQKYNEDKLQRELSKVSSKTDDVIGRSKSNAIITVSILIKSDETKRIKLRHPIKEDWKAKEKVTRIWSKDKNQLKNDIVKEINLMLEEEAIDFHWGKLM